MLYICIYNVYIYIYNLYIYICIYKYISCIDRMDPMLFVFLPNAPQMDFFRPPLHNPETNDATYGLDGDPSPMKVKEDIASFFPVTLQRGAL